MQIACVLKQGPEYRPVHVAALAESILAHNDVKIVCLTDAEHIPHPAVKKIPLRNDWKGWWSKLELFRECEGPTLYLDLDTVVVGKLPEIGPRFTMLSDVYRTGDFGSGVMSWQTSPVHVYKKFCRNPKAFMQIYNTRARWGDQAFIRDALDDVPDIFGSEYRSYKMHCRTKVPAGTKVVYFHGKPRPWQVDLCL